MNRPWEYDWRSQARFGDGHGIPRGRYSNARPEFDSRRVLGGQGQRQKRIEVDLARRAAVVALALERAGGIQDAPELAGSPSVDLEDSTGRCAHTSRPPPLRMLIGATVSNSVWSTHAGAAWTTLGTIQFRRVGRVSCVLTYSSIDPPKYIL